MAEALDEAGRVRFVNPAAEQFFDAGANLLQGRGLADLVPFGSPLLGLVEQVRDTQIDVSERGVDLGTSSTGPKPVDIRVSPLADHPGWLLVTLQPRSIAEKMDRQLTHRGAARTVTGMALVLAHEIKNPLSGIRGAAQLLEQNAGEADRELAQLIRDEVDRICGLVDRMEAFTDQPIAREPVNIHQVLEHVRAIAANGFARHVRFAESYDPSLPAVLGSRDLLVQCFLNLIKNAAEAVPEESGEITLKTAYKPGVRLAVAGGRERVHLPLEVSVHDNGGGIPEDLQPHLFDPFVTTKVNGTGLGLALVAKIVGDHGGLIEVESAPRRTVFRVRLPVHRPNGEG
jgi:two-component system nitrogen regulation sensor histidine kinase GlnL